MRENTDNFKKKAKGQVQVGKGTEIRKAPKIGEVLPEKIEKSELDEFWEQYPNYEDIYYRIRGDFIKFLKKKRAKNNG